MLAVVAIGAALAMIPWTILLGLDLPARYVARHWSVTWVGFDAALIVGFTTIGAAAWLHSRVLAPAAIVTATLLACDAWFDLTTASPHDLGGSMLTALGEIPIAAALAYLVARWRRRVATPPPPEPQH